MRETPKQSQEMVQVEWLVTIVGGAARHRLAPDVIRTERGHDDDVCAGRSFLQEGQEVQATGSLGARKSDVQKSQIEHLFLDCLLGLIAAEALGYLGSCPP